MRFQFPSRDRFHAAIGNVLHVRRSELDRTLRMGSLAVVLGCAMYTAFNATQAIFLTQTEARAYPLFFVVLALAVWPAIAASAAASRRWGIAKAFRYVLLLNAILPIPILIAYSASETYMVSFVVYVIYSVSFEIVMLQFWAFVSQYFNILEAKRIFPVIAAGSGLGYIFAGALTSLVTNLSGRPEGLLFVWAAGAALAGLISYRAERRLHRPPVEEDADEFMTEQHQPGSRTRRHHRVRDSLRYLLASRLVLVLLLLGTLLMIAMRVSDYLVALVFVQSTHDIKELTILIGNAWMISYVVQLGLGLWVTPWLLAKAGVRNAILALPMATLFGFACVTWAPGLAASLFLFVVRNGLQTGVDDPAQQVLTGALPEQVAPRLKHLQDNLVLPGSAVLTGMTLLLVSGFYGQASVIFLAGLGIVICAAFLVAAIWVRSLYVNAVYQRLRAHTLSLSDLELALGRPSLLEVDELKGYIQSEGKEVREFAAAALGRLAPDRFLEIVPGLTRSPEAGLRRLAFEMAKPGSISLSLIEAGAADPDPWVTAAAAVAGLCHRPAWSPGGDILRNLQHSKEPEARAAAVWASAAVGDPDQVALALGDPDPIVRLEAIKSYARLKGHVAGSAQGLVHCMRDESTEVRREALRQAIRWTPGPNVVDEVADALVWNLHSPDPLSRRLAGQAIAVQCPAALDRTMEFLSGETQVAVATVEALFRSSRADLRSRATAHLEVVLDLAVESAEHARRLSSGDDYRHVVLRIALEDYRRHAIELCLAGLRSLHEKRGFARVERGLRAADPGARAEATETLLNFGPARLVEPLVRLLDPESFEGAAARPLSEDEMEKLEAHPHEWVALAARSMHLESKENMKDLIALKKVPLFANLTLEQLASIDKLMVTRRYLKGEHIFRLGDLSSELYVIVEGEVRIHRDHRSRMMTLATLRASDVMGEMAPFTDQPRSAGAQAVTPTTVRVLRKDRLEAILHEHPEVLLEVIRNLSHRLVIANEQLEALQPRPEPQPDFKPAAASSKQDGKAAAKAKAPPRGRGTAGSRA